MRINSLFPSSFITGGGLAAGASTSPGRLESLADLIGVNRRFHGPRFDEIDRRDDVIASPVEARLVAQGPVAADGSIPSKNGRRILLSDAMGGDAALFSSGRYMNLYLSPTDRHYWRAPYAGRFVSTRVNDGKALLPIFIGLESFFKKADLFPSAVKSNASVSSVLMTDAFPIGMIAVGSLCVNAIHVLYDEGVRYEKGDLVGCFSIGSSMLLLYPDSAIHSLLDEGWKVSLGQAIAVMDRRHA